MMVYPMPIFPYKYEKWIINCVIHLKLWINLGKKAK